MPAEIGVTDAARGRVTGWRVVQGELLVRSAESVDELVLRCDRCGRRHWVIETEAGALAVTCHGCGAKRRLLLPESVLPSP